MIFDIGIGFLIASLMGALAEQSPAIGFILLGAGGALAPDIDALVWLVRSRGRIDEWMHRHRDLLHYPLLFVPVAALVGWTIQGSMGAVLLAGCSFAHFLHDSGSEGWGIRWLWPLDRRYFQFVRSTGGWERRIWTRQEQDAAVRRGGDARWFKRAYGRGGDRLKMELIMFGTGTLAAAIWLTLG